MQKGEQEKNDDGDDAGRDMDARRTSSPPLIGSVIVASPLGRSTGLGTDEAEETVFLQGDDNFAVAISGQRRVRDVFNF